LKIDIAEYPPNLSLGPGHGRVPCFSDIVNDLWSRIFVATHGAFHLSSSEVTSCEINRQFNLLHKSESLLENSIDIDSYDKKTNNEPSLVEREKWIAITSDASLLLL
jgi:hypothetical protein